MSVRGRGSSRFFPISSNEKARSLVARPTDSMTDCPRPALLLSKIQTRVSARTNQRQSPHPKMPPVLMLYPLPSRLPVHHVRCLSSPTWRIISIWVRKLRLAIMHRVANWFRYPLTLQPLSAPNYKPVPPLAHTKISEKLLISPTLLHRQ